jgi:hypothetical protein
MKIVKKQIATASSDIQIAMFVIIEFVSKGQ